MDIRTILSTEQRLLEPICEFSDYGDYSVYRSDVFPRYYGGNGIDIHTPRGRSLAQWEEIFGEHFDPARYEHTTFTFPHEAAYATLVEEARRAGYHVDITSFMFADETARCKPIPPGLEVRKVKSEEEWSRLERLAFEDEADFDWYDPNATGNSLFRKTRFISEAIGIDWFYLARAGEEEMLASLGIFKHNGICRLQDVRTGLGHRRRGFGALLVSFAIAHAIDTLGAAGVALCADRDYYAIDLYRKLGFEERGDAVCLMKYPVRNPAYL